MLCQHVLFKMFDSIAFALYNKLNSKKGDDILTLGDIIKDYRKTNKMSMDLFAEKSGLSKAYISLLEKNRHPKTGKPIAPSIQCIKQAAKGMNVDFNILFGKINGDVLLLDEKGTDSITIDNNSLPNSTKRKGIPVNVLGRVAADIPIESVEEIIDTEEITEELAVTGDFFGLQIKGDSMEPRLVEGDVVIVRQQDDAESGETVIVLINGEDATCKRLKKYSDGIMLLSNNPKYEPMVFSKQEIIDKSVKIIGKVVELRGKF